MTSVSIDGSVLEGGGQILRNSVSLSALLNTPISITKIRTGRKPPGLKNQHRVGIEVAAEICSGRVQGAENGSTAIDFHPSSTKIPCHAIADAVTAGSTALLLQTALPMLLFAPVLPEEALPSSLPEPSTLILRGGTNASQAPQIEYTQHILVPFLKRHFGIDCGLEISLKKRGYYPRGGGELLVSIPSRIEPLKPIQLSTEQGRLIRIGGLSHVGRLPASLATEMAGGALKRLAEAGFNSSTADSPAPNNSQQETVIPIEIQIKRERNDDCLGAGSGIVLWAELEGGGMIGGSALGRKNVSPEQVGEAAADDLIEGLKEGGCVDEHLQDQIIIFMALAAGRSSVLTGPISLHTQTAIWLAEKLTEAKFDVVEQPSGQCVISCKGIAYQRAAA